MLISICIFVGFFMLKCLEMPGSGTFGAIVERVVAAPLFYCLMKALRPASVLGL